MSKLQVTSPKGNLKWVFITGKGRLNQLNGKEEFTASVEVPMDEAQPLIDELQSFWDENKPKGAKDPKSTGYKVDEDGQTVTFNFKTHTSFPSGEAKVIKVFNAKAQQIKLPADTKIGLGSRGRVSGVASIYDAGPAARGISLYLDAVQLTKFVEYQEPHDFEEEEDGFEGFQMELPFAEEAPE